MPIWIQVPTTAPESREPYAGISIRQNIGNEVDRNRVRTLSEEDFSYVSDGVIDGIDNKVKQLNKPLRFKNRT